MVTKHKNGSESHDDIIENNSAANFILEGENVISKGNITINPVTYFSRLF
ncbi:MAG: hypothetical protein R2771_10485 [Saprospiraceae bacterium]